MLILDYFSRAYVINLRARPDRRNEMLAMFRRIGVDALPARVEFFPAIRPDGPGEFPSVGAHGCFMSHLNLLRDAVARGAQSVLVMEDDLEISEDLVALEGRLVEVLRSSDWGLVYFGHSADGLPGPKDSVLVPWSGQTKCAHFYGVQQPALGALIAFLETILQRHAGDPLGGPMHYDGALTTFREQTGTKTLFSKTNLGWQRSSRSDIAAGRWFDRLPLSARTVARARKLKNRMRRLLERVWSSQSARSVLYR